MVCNTNIYALFSAASNPCCQAGIDIANAIRSVSACPFLTDEEAAANPCRITEEQCCRCCGFGHLIRKASGVPGCLSQAGAFAQCGAIFNDCCLDEVIGKTYAWQRVNPLVPNTCRLQGTYCGCVGTLLMLYDCMVLITSVSYWQVFSQCNYYNREVCYLYSRLCANVAQTQCTLKCRF